MSCLPPVLPRSRREAAKGIYISSEESQAQCSDKRKIEFTNEIENERNPYIHFSLEVSMTFSSEYGMKYGIHSEVGRFSFSRLSEAAHSSP